MSEIKLTEKEKDQIGRKCCNCGSIESLQYHHIVPLTFGGNNIPSNICCLCYKCHSLIHFGKVKNINHSEATKAGLQRARERGTRLGIEKGTKLTTKKSIESKKLILELNIDFNSTLSNEDTYKQISISRNAFYKYKKELREELLSSKNT